MNTRKAAKERSAIGTSVAERMAKKRNFAAQNRAVSAKKAKTTKPSSSSTAKAPPAPTQPLRQISSMVYCSWVQAGFNGCTLPQQKMESCGKCKAGVHACCQIVWEKNNNFEDDDGASFGLMCFHHHPHNNKGGSKSSSAGSESGDPTAEVLVDQVVNCASCDWKLPNSDVCGMSKKNSIKVCSFDGCTRPVAR